MDVRKSYRIEAVGRALSILEALAENPGQGVTALAERMGLTKSIVFRLLYTLEERGFVHRESERATYALGFRVGVLGERVGRDGTLLHVAPPVMEGLRDRTGENVNLVVREGMQTLVLATREGLHSIRLYARSGRHGPLHAGGGSMLLLAHAEPALIDEVLAARLDAFTPYTQTDPEKLREVLRRIRENGYNVAMNDLDDGAFSVAAPIRDSRGAVVAAISVAGAVVRFDEDRRGRYLDAVRDAAAAISSKLALV